MFRSMSKQGENFAGTLLKGAVVLITIPLAGEGWACLHAAHACHPPPTLHPRACCSCATQLRKQEPSQ